jgi:glucose/mannose transport system permease protein
LASHFNTNEWLHYAFHTRLPKVSLHPQHPTELVEASRFDGAGIFGVYRHVLFPLSLPGFVVALIWQFTSIWNEFLFAIVLTSNPNVQPIMVALNNLAGSYSVQWNAQIAGA